MRRALRLSAARLLCSQQAAAGALGAPTLLPPGPSGSLAPLAPTDGCRTIAWGSRSHDRRLGAARAFATAPAADNGALKQFRLAQTGEGIKECELVRWFVAEGDAVEEFDRVCEVQSDKATIEISSPYAGVVRKLHHTSGDVIQVGDVLADIHQAGAANGDSAHSSPPPKQHPSAAAAAATGGAAPGRAGGAAEGQAPAPGLDAWQERPPSTGGSGSREEGEVAEKVLTSPAVRRLARESGISLAKVPATGPGGRVLKGDVLAYLDAQGALGASTEEAGVAGVPVAAAAAKPAPPHPAAAAAAAVVAAAAAAAGGSSTEPVVIPLRGYRKAMVRSMAAAAQIPHFHFCEEVQMDALVELRTRLRGDPSLQGVKLTFLPFFMKAAALALREYPLVNASLAPDQASVLAHRRVNLGVAMATPHGLAVPNIKDVQDKPVVQLAAELARLTAAAADNRLTQEDISGGTFTISNIGTIGGTYATPLVNVPEVAIMAVGRVQRLPRFAEDGRTVVPSNIMSVSLGADHRVVDGAMLAGFAQAWRRYVESPGTLLLHLR